MSKKALATRMLEFMQELYPICRSITGNGVRETLSRIQAWVPLEIREVPSGTAVFDWTVPDEWNVRDAYIEDMEGRRVVDFRDSNLHVLNYSEPINAVIGRDELDEHLFSIPEHPDWIPYRTSYYTRNWGFCIQHERRLRMQDSQYSVVIDSSLEPGSLTYGELIIPGDIDREILIYTHICHPALCNDNLSGIVIAATLCQQLEALERRRYSYRIVFGPGTIGSITWLSKNQNFLSRIAHGLTIGLLGDPAPHTYKKSRSGDREIDRVAEYVLSRRSSENKIVEFSPYGYDERQFCSPGIDLPVGRLTRSVNGGYEEYHTSADSMDLISDDRLLESLDVLREILTVLEGNVTYVNLLPHCEPQLGKRGLYKNTGGEDLKDRESALLWMLNQSDGTNSVLDIALKSGLDFDLLARTGEELLGAGLLRMESEEASV